MSDLIGATIAWLASTGAPNGIVLLAFLTHPAVWSDEVVSRVGPLLDRVFPTRETEAAAVEAGEEA